MSETVLIGCGKLKHPRPMPAQHLYRSVYIRYAVGWAHSIGVTPIIFSARYGLVEGTRTLAPYDSSFVNGTAQTGADQVRAQAEKLALPSRLIVLAGAAYRDVLAEALPETELATPFVDLARERWGRGTRGYQVKLMREFWGRVPGAE